MGARSPVGGGRGEGFCLRYAIGCGLRERRTAGGRYEITLAFRWIGWMDGKLGMDREFGMAPSLLLRFLEDE